MYLYYCTRRLAPSYVIVSDGSLINQKSKKIRKKDDTNIIPFYFPRVIQSISCLVTNETGSSLAIDIEHAAWFIAQIPVI